MERYIINNSNADIGIKTYELSSSYNNVDSIFFEFYLTAPHLLNDGTLINVSDEDDIDIILNTSVYLRKQIKIGIYVISGTSLNFGLKWRYVDDSNDWQNIGIVTTTSVINQPLLGYEDISTFSNYSIDYQINSNNIVQVRETNSSIWQDLIYVSEINDIVTSGTFLSINSNIKTIRINDTYLRIVPFDLYREINILKRGYDDTRTSYIFTTDYFIENGIFITTLETGDEIWVTLKSELLEPDNLILPELYDPSSIDISLDGYWMQQDWFNPNVASFIEYGKWYSVTQGSVVYNGTTYTTSSQPFQGTDNPSFDSFSNDAIVYVVDNFYGVFGGSTDPVPAPVDEDEIISVLINVEPPCESDVFYTFTIKNLDEDISPDRIDILYKLIDLNTVYFWKEFGNYQIGINMETSFSVNTQQSDLVNRDFFDAERAKVINPISDNERIRFEPYYPVPVSTTDPFGFRKINSINFKLNFNKINDDGTITTTTQKWEDLGFTDEDVKYQKSRLKNTFLRLSYYDVQNPTVQLLEHYNTVFVDTNMMYADYANGLNNMGGINPVDNLPFMEMVNGVLVPTGGFSTSFYVYNPYIREIVRDASKNITYSYSNSSEGFFVYLYGDEYKDSIPSDIFMKLEFNNAMSGQRTLFFNRTNISTPAALNNVFFDIPDSLNPTSRNYVYVRFMVVYNKDLDKYIYYPAPDSLLTTGTGTVSLDSDYKDRMNITLYEANVQ